ncbi:alkaline ceramidase 3-like [Gigantopelta aegis]|uniref:alkaline ceramidase 3-like n=1 Tax=Gigantopelta aegis TaxID=1735272 RepID=UPI001B887704|nr:alkaline ceramidase 3-like [Gigantopelta aegis]
MAPSVGYWGRPTSTLDWCEENYVVSYYIAEFWNTISNLVMIIPPLVGASLAYWQDLEFRIVNSYLGFMAVGIGSWIFHMTLLYEGQLLDELPMIWGSSFLVYSYATLSSPPNRVYKPLMLGLFIYCSIVTVGYLINQNPIFHQVAYALMVFAILVYGVKTILTCQHNLPMYIISGLTYFFGFFLWNIDNKFCGYLTHLRHDVLGPLGPITELHAWWHVLAGSGTYLSLLFLTHTRYLFLRRNPKIKFFWRVYPYVTITTRATGRFCPTPSS